MTRRDLLKTMAALGMSYTALPMISAADKYDLNFFEDELKKADFGSGFRWGIATAAYQIEGNWNVDGKGESVWDRFSHTSGKIYQNQNGDIACDSYNRFGEDIELIKQMNLRVNRFSLAWTRILPQGTGAANQKGLDYYNRVIDKCLSTGIEPWITLYHWDLPQALEDKGGWTNRDIINWFSEYVDVCSKAFGDRVKNWMILNEPFVFTTFGYFLGNNAPGKKGIKNYLKAIHHAALCQAEGGRTVRKNVKDSQTGTTFNCSSCEPADNSEKNTEAANRYDALVNRMFIEPSLGMGYPIKDLKFLERIEKYMKPGDEEKMKFDFDFIGIQNYTREVIKHSSFMPFIWGKSIDPEKRGTNQLTDMNWEIYPEGIYKLLKKYGAYRGVKKIYITENGAAFKDKLENGKVRDSERIQFFKDYLKQILKAKNEGVNVNGYFIWSLLDNFEWNEGYRPRFGIVYVDYATQKRFIKDSGWWLKEFLK